MPPPNREYALAREPVSPCPLPDVRGLSRAQAAAYIGVSPSLFDKLVDDGRMPLAKRINSRTIWDRLALDKAFDRLPGGSCEDDGEWHFEV